MTFVVTLENFRPSPRVDGVPWVRAGIEESASIAPPSWARLETQDFAEIDDDPRDPMIRTVTTVLATLEAGWYRLVFEDASGGMEVTEPVGRAGMGVLMPPQPDDVRERSELLRKLYPADPLDADVERGLREDVADAAALVESMTCRKLDATLPAEFTRLALRAVTLKTEQLAVLGNASRVERTAEGKRLRSFSAGPYSESYFAPGELIVKNGRPQMDPDARLAEVLWALATEECREAFIALIGGPQPPAGIVTPFDYRRGGGGYFARGLGAGIGPDGY